MADSARSYKTYRKRRSLRLPGFDYSQSRVYHLTWGTRRRRPLLASTTLAERIIKAFTEETNRMGIALLAYCLMPDHMHLLVQPEDGVDVVAFVRRVKSRTTRIYWSEGEAGRLWQRGFYDHVLRGDEDVLHTARYVLANPVRAGLVSEPTEYPFSGSLLFGDDENVAHGT